MTIVSNSTCDQCGITSEEYSESNADKLSFASCESCGGVFCKSCLADGAIDAGYIDAIDAGRIYIHEYEADALMFKDDDWGYICPKCYSSKEQ